MRLARVFPRRTKATPDDALAFVGDPPLLRPAIDEVHVSCAFTWDLLEAERLADSWGRYYPTRLGGPATGERGAEFLPGRYLKPGYTITSRGCPNRCWFCSVWKREGNEVRELPIRDGWNVLDDNLLRTSDAHFSEVCAMLKRQQEPAEFTGGLEAAALTEYHANLLADLKPKQLFFAYDTPDDLGALREAGKMLSPEWPLPRSHVLRAYVLVGYPRDTFADAERRMRETIGAGFMPMAMLYRDESGKYDREWKQFQRGWANPIICASKVAARTEASS